MIGTMWKSVCNVHNLTNFGYRKRMAIYLCLFIFYAVQLALYRKGLNQGLLHDSKRNSEYLIAIDVLMLVQSIVALGCGWIFRSSFPSISVIFNAILFGLTFGWLILAAPNATEHQIYFGVNSAVVLLLIIIDVSVMFYVRPEVIAVANNGMTKTKKGSRKSLNPAQISTGSSNPKMSTTEKLRGAVSSMLPSYGGKVRHRFLHSEDDHNIQHAGPMAEKADEEMGISDKEGFINAFGAETSKASSNNHSSSSAATSRRNSAQSIVSSSTSPFHEDVTSSTSDNNNNDLHSIGDNNDEEKEVIYGGYKIDTADKAICEGFRVKMGNLPTFDSNQTPRNLTWDDFSQIQHIVDSSSCHIYTALWKHQAVVLKLIKAERVSSAIAVAEFDAEEGVLSRIRHPNIVRFLGSGKVPRKFLVLELLSGGSLSHTLGLRADSRNQTWEKRFTFLETLDFALSLARALKYLHHDWSPSVHIIHRDLKPDNIGFAKDGRVKLFDFGLCASVRAQREKTEQYRLTGNTGTLRYMAPEVVLGRSYHQSVDVYSFGILLWQIASGKVPFRDMGKKTYFDRVVVGGQRPRIDARWPLAFAHLLRQCWHEDKHARPNFVTIVQELEILVRQEESMVVAQYNQLHRRVARSCLWCIQQFRPLFFLIIVGVFIASLYIIVDQDDTVIGAMLGAVSSFGIYAILMSYLSIWPAASLSPLSSSPSLPGAGAGTGNDDIIERIEHQRKMRSLTSNARFVLNAGAEARQHASHEHSGGMIAMTAIVPPSSNAGAAGTTSTSLRRGVSGNSSNINGGNYSPTSPPPPSQKRSHVHVQQQQLSTTASPHRGVTPPPPVSTTPHSLSLPLPLPPSFPIDVHNPPAEMKESESSSHEFETLPLTTPMTV